jgi:uncharacterized cupredoxin-like copper-binding protein
LPLKFYPRDVAPSVFATRAERSWATECFAANPQGYQMTHRSVHPALLGILLLCSATFVSAASAAEPATVKVSLSDKNGKDRIILSTDKVKAGAVEFEIKNLSAHQMHEFLIVPWQGAITALPYDANKGQVVEEKVPQLAGVEDMKPGAEATLRLPLKAGKYVVFCNQPDHYKLGMVARFTAVR